MKPVVVLLSVPGLRQRDLASMPALTELVRAGEEARLVPSFPAVTCPVQANMTCGALPSEHGVVANGFYWRDTNRVEMWTAWNDCIDRPQIWDRLRQWDPSLKSAVWFPLHSKGCGADYMCAPAPIHNEDGTESLWCHTRPETLYQELVDELGHFPLHHFWGPVANIQSTSWIVDSAIRAADEFRPDFLYIYLPHLDYVGQKQGPDTGAFSDSLVELDNEIRKLAQGLSQMAREDSLLWLVASEYAVVPVDHVTFPNRLLREAGLLEVCQQEDGEYLDLRNSRAWALADHQFSHVFVQNADPQTIKQVMDCFTHVPGIARVLAAKDFKRFGLDHPRTGEVVLVSEPNSWQAYYWWQQESCAPSFARTVDIHRKPGYDPVELFFDPGTKGIPLDASLVCGSHGAPATDPAQQGVVLASKPGILGKSQLADTEVAACVLKAFGLPVVENQ